MGIKNRDNMKTHIVLVFIISLLLIVNLEVVISHNYETVINRGVRHYGRIKEKYTVQLQYNIINDISVALIESDVNYGFVVYQKTPYLPFYRYITSLFGSEPVVHREDGHRAFMLNLSFNPINEQNIRSLLSADYDYSNEEMITLVVFKSESDSFTVSYETYKPDAYIIKQPYTILIWTKRTDDMHKLFTDYIVEGHR